MDRNAEALEELAEQAQIAADRRCRRDLRVVALGYERLAENARIRRSKEGTELSSRSEQRAE
jgi:hypothetical protein